MVHLYSRFFFLEMPAKFFLDGSTVVNLRPRVRPALAGPA